ncbi:MAG TPA: hypothetical protein VEJ67_04420 [Candidatus Cybelea sp.]|nr:hypothetical protein [Candidatus Cybelea sp.]
MAATDFVFAIATRRCNSVQARRGPEADIDISTLQKAGHFYFALTFRANASV